MTKPADEDEVRRALRSLRDATPTSYGPSPFASIEAKLRERFLDLTPFEVAFALHRAAPLEMLPLGFGVDTEARIHALREAERRIGVPRPAFHEIVAEVLPRLLAIHLSDPDAIEAAVRARIAAIQEAAPAQRKGPARRGFTEYDIRKATDAVRHRTGARPTQLAVADELGTSEPTLKRIISELQMGRWPPPPLHEPKVDLS